MADDIDRDDVPAPTPAAPPRRRRHWLRWIITIVVLVPLLVISLWTAIALNWSYSRGYRSGYVQKFSRKGWLCKTWEGELAIVNVPGSQPEIFRFTVRKDSIASLLQHAMGDRVTLQYAQHVGIPVSCFGDTQYFVEGVQAITEMTPTAPAPPMPATPSGSGATNTPGPGATPRP
ncbi:MAG TPA: hypothetical protein VF761_15415 [Gemmatimonadaceae bacterium]